MQIKPGLLCGVCKCSIAIIAPKRVRDPFCRIIEISGTVFAMVNEGGDKQIWETRFRCIRCCNTDWNSIRRQINIDTGFQHLLRLIW